MSFSVNQVDPHEKLVPN